MAWGDDYERAYGRRYPYGSPWFGTGPAGYGWWGPGRDAFWGAGPEWGGYGYGYGGGPTWAADYDRAYRRLPPERSSTYGRGGDEAARRWARRAGYDVGYSVEPRETGPPRRWMAERGYDRGLRRGRGYDRSYGAGWQF